METYRIINRELSINNQELRNVINKLKHEVTFLNRQLFEQREEFVRLKTSIARTIEKKYIETMAVICPERNLQRKTSSQSKFDIKSHRRSCSNVTAADQFSKRSCSPPASSPSVHNVVADKTPLPRIVIERDGRISKSPGKCPPQRVSNQNESRNSTDLQNSKNCTERYNNSDDSDLGQTLINSNISLHTINEEQSCRMEQQNDTLSDNTINCLLDAPCSTPYHANRVASTITSETNFEPKQVRVLVKRLRVEGCAPSNISHDKTIHCTQSSPYRIKTLNKTSFKAANTLIAACFVESNRSEMNASHLNSINNTLYETKYHREVSSASESSPDPVPHKIKINERRKPARDQVIETQEPPKGKQNKENDDSNSIFDASHLNNTLRKTKKHRGVPSAGESSPDPVPTKFKINERRKPARDQVIKTQKPPKEKQNKENDDSDSDFAVSHLNNTLRKTKNHRGVPSAGESSPDPVPHKIKINRKPARDQVIKTQKPPKEKQNKENDDSDSDFAVSHLNNTLRKTKNPRGVSSAGESSPGPVPTKIKINERRKPARDQVIKTKKPPKRDKKNDDSNSNFDASNLSSTKNTRYHGGVSSASESSPDPVPQKIKINEKRKPAREQEIKTQKPPKEKQNKENDDSNSDVDNLSSIKNTLYKARNHRRIVSSASESSPEPVPNKMKINEKRKPANQKLVKPQKPTKGKQNKENDDSISDFTGSDEEYNPGVRRLRKKQLSLKEPSLRAKLRNTTNIKL